MKDQDSLFLPTGITVGRAKKIAKKISNAQSIPLHTAKTIVAQAHGFPEAKNFESVLQNLIPKKNNLTPREFIEREVEILLKLPMWIDLYSTREFSITPKSIEHLLNRYFDHLNDSELILIRKILSDNNLKSYKLPPTFILALAAEPALDRKLKIIGEFTGGDIKKLPRLHLNSIFFTPDRFIKAFFNFRSHNFRYDFGTTPDGRTFFEIVSPNAIKLVSTNPELIKSIIRNSPTDLILLKGQDKDRELLNQLTDWEITTDFNRKNSRIRPLGNYNFVISTRTHYRR